MSAQGGWVRVGAHGEQVRVSAQTVHVIAYEDGRNVADMQVRGVTVEDAIERVRQALGSAGGGMVAYTYQVYVDCPYCHGEGLLPAYGDDGQ